MPTRLVGGTGMANGISPQDAMQALAWFKANSVRDTDPLPNGDTLGIPPSGPQPSPGYYSGMYRFKIQPELLPGNQWSNIQRVEPHQPGWMGEDTPLLFFLQRLLGR